MPFDYYKKLPARVRRIYDRSNEVGVVRLPRPERLRPQVDALARALGTSARQATESAAQSLAAAMLEELRLPGVEVRVLAKRPSRRWGELHGLYEPQPRGKPRITVWMRTAQRRQVVAFKTFLRTLLHEIGHHLDYELLDLEDSLHTEGFYKRESSLFRQLVPDPERYVTEPRGERVGTAKVGGVRSGAVAAGRRQAESLELGRSRRRAAADTAVAPTVLQPQLPFTDAGEEEPAGERRIAPSADRVKTRVRAIRPSGPAHAFRSPPRTGRDG